MMKTATLAAFSVLTAACAEEAADVIAAAPPGHDLSCLGVLPASAPDSIRFRGSLVHASDMGYPLLIRRATIRAATSDRVLARTISDEGGWIDLALATDARPVAAHFEIEHDDLPPARLYANLPVAVEPEIWFAFAAGPERLDQIAGALGVARDPALGVVEITIEDCAGAAVPGAIVSLSSRGDDEPWAVLQPDATWAVGDVAGGTAGRAHASVIAAANVPPGPATVTVTYEGETFPVGEIDVVAGGWTFIDVRPGAH